jgi:hypothetical protein
MKFIVKVKRLQIMSDFHCMIFSIFCHSERSEESASINQILHYAGGSPAQNDKFYCLYQKDF